MTASRWVETASDRNPQGNAAGPYDEIGRILVELPRPRPVRLCASFYEVILPGKT